MAILAIKPLVSTLISKTIFNVSNRFKMASRNSNSLLQWDELEAEETSQYERNRRLRGDDNEPPLEEDECEFDNAHTENEI